MTRLNPWIKWEDWRNGLYHRDFLADHVSDSLRLLTDPDRFADTATEMFTEWPAATLHNLINMISGRNAWIGQASCLYAHGAPKAATCEAWGQMTQQQQNDANGVAVHVRSVWERGHRGSQTLFT